MRYLILLLLFYMTGNAQLGVHTANDSLKAILTEVELKKAKEDYLKMMNSKVYIQAKECRLKLYKKLNHVKLPANDELESWLKDSDKIIDWLKHNIGKTKFTSIDEGYKDILESFMLSNKVYEENTDLYNLMSKASREQLSEILEPELKSNRLR